MAEAEKQLVIVVEGTSLMSRHWRRLMFPYVERIVRRVCGFDMEGKIVSTSIVDMAFVLFNVPESNWLVQRSPWTKDMGSFLQWLIMIDFDDTDGPAATWEGLSEALLLFTLDPDATEKSKHCILVAGSDPFLFDRPHAYRGVYQPIPTMYSSSFLEWDISFSVISPRYLRSLIATFIREQPLSTIICALPNLYEHLVLLPGTFKEACVALGIFSSTSMPTEAFPIFLKNPDLNEKLSELPLDQQFHPFDLELAAFDLEQVHPEQQLSIRMDLPLEQQSSIHFPELESPEIEALMSAWLEEMEPLEQQQSAIVQEQQQTAESQDVVTNDPKT